MERVKAKLNKSGQRSSKTSDHLIWIIGFKIQAKDWMKVNIAKVKYEYHQLDQHVYYGDLGEKEKVR